MDPPRWAALTRAVQDALARPEVAGVVVSHGTDTLEETAWWLDLTVGSDKPVVLIGAQSNASEPDFDGPRNLLNAVRIATDPASAGKGVVLAMNGQINAARDVAKTHTTNVETFQSGQWGLLGAVDPDRVVWARAPLRRQHLPIRSDRKSTRLNSSHANISYAVFCLKKKKIPISLTLISCCQSK